MKINGTGNNISIGGDNVTQTMNIVNGKVFNPIDTIKVLFNIFLIHKIKEEGLSLQEYDFNVKLEDKIFTFTMEFVNKNNLMIPVMLNEEQYSEIMNNEWESFISDIAKPLILSVVKQITKRIENYKA